MEIPHEYICPITMEIMVHPLASRHGQNYERSAIVGWLQKGNGMCPITRHPLTLSDLIHNNRLAMKIQLWCDINGVELKNGSSSNNSSQTSFSGCDDTDDDSDTSSTMAWDAAALKRLTHVYGTIDTMIETTKITAEQFTTGDEVISSDPVRPQRTSFWRRLRRTQ